MNDEVTCPECGSDDIVPMGYGVLRCLECLFMFDDEEALEETLEPRDRGEADEWETER